jgi:hypothetical protein
MRYGRHGGILQLRRDLRDSEKVIGPGAQIGRPDDAV